MGSPNPTKPLN